MILPGALAVLAPVVVGFLLGPKALGGMLGKTLICYCYDGFNDVKCWWSLG